MDSKNNKVDIECGYIGLNLEMAYREGAYRSNGCEVYWEGIEKRFENMSKENDEVRQVK